MSHNNRFKINKRYSFIKNVQTMNKKRLKYSTLACIGHTRIALHSVLTDKESVEPKVANFLCKQRNNICRKKIIYLSKKRYERVRKKNPPYCELVG